MSGQKGSAEPSERKRWVIRAAVLGCGAALVLAACGGDSPESLEAAIREAAPTLAFADEPEAPCIAQTILIEVGFAGLTSDGHSTESLGAAPSDAIDSIVSAYADEIKDGVVECLNADTLIRPALVALNDGDELACSDEFDLETPFVHDYVEARFDRAEVELTIDDTEDNRDLLRPCLQEASFAMTFGVDTRDDLEAAIEAALPTAMHAAGDPCVSTLVVDHFGSAELCVRPN